MGLIDRLLNKTVFIDSAPIIYFIEGHSIYHKKLEQVFIANNEGKIHFQTSTLTLMEVLVHPLRLNQTELAEQYERILANSKRIDLFDLDKEISKLAAKLRADYNLKTPDAIQVATGIAKGAEIFFTNDADLKRVSGIEVIVLKEF